MTEDKSFPILRAAFRTGPYEFIAGWAHAIPKEARDEIVALLAQRDGLEAAWDMTHWDCNNPDHSEAYRIGAEALGYVEKVPDGAWTPVEQTHLAAPPRAICNRCGRVTYAATDIGEKDTMTQPSGEPCGGTFVTHLPPARLGENKIL